MAKRKKKQKHMSARKRRSLKKSQFGLPEKRAYPVNDKAHARNAKARASQQYKKGRLTKSQRDRINAKANRVLGKKKSGGRKKR